jgi:GDP-L-fucose synthase
MPTNLYGPNDNFDLEKSHVLPALIRKIYLAKLLSENKREAIIKDLEVADFEQAKAVLIHYGITEKTVEIWGSGKPKREFLWSEDMADACIHIMHHVDFKDVISDENEIRNTHINIGTGKDISIVDLAILIKEVIGYKGDFLFNTDKPDGTLRKVTDVSKLEKLKWKHSVSLENGIQRMYEWYQFQLNE